MPEDDAMDLNDEGVEAAAKAMFDSWVARGRFSIPIHAQHESWQRLDGAGRQFWREWAKAALRAVPESDELVRLRAALKSIVDRHPDSPLGEHPAVDIARAALFPVACDE